MTAQIASLRLPTASAEVVSSDDGRYHYSDEEDGRACATAIAPGPRGDSVTLCFDTGTMHLFAVTTLPRGWHFRVGPSDIHPDRYRTQISGTLTVTAAPIEPATLALLARATVDIGLCYRNRCQDISGIGPYAQALLQYAIANSGQGQVAL